MEDEERLAGLVGDIYDAALDPSRWVSVLAKVADFADGTAASIHYKDAGGKSGDAFHVFGVDPYYRKLYFDRYIEVDPTTVGYVLGEIGEPIAVADIMPYEEFLTSQFHREWVQPQGLVDCASVVLDKSETSAAMFCVFRHQRDGVVDDTMRQRMRLMTPHIRRSALIGRLIDLQADRAMTFTEILDGVRACMFAVEADARIVHANAAGRVMLDSRDLFRSIRGRLVAVDAETDEMLREAFTAAGSGDAAMGIKGIAIPLIADTGERHVAHVLPLTSGQRRHAGIGYTAVATVFVHRVASVIASAPEVIAKSYRLTPTELRVLLTLVEVGGVSAISATLGITRATVRGHLRRLFEKTGTGRQADLVKLVAGFSSPLAG